MGTFDIETEGWDQFFCGALLDQKGARVRTYRHTNERDLVEAILNVREGDLFAHNGGRFDFLWLIDAIFRFNLLEEGMRIEISDSGSAIVSMRFTGPSINLTLRDSYRMFPVSLGKMGGKGEVGIACEGLRTECEELARLQSSLGRPVIGCGGYCAIRRDMPPHLAARVIDYCAQDCRALWDGTTRLIHFAQEEMGLTLGGTTGATAWKTAKTWKLIDRTELQHRDWMWIRQGYYGGRVGLFRPEAPSGSHYDITSSYPYQTSQALPHGPAQFEPAPSDARRAYRRSAPGLYRAKVTMPDMWIPPLPWRAKIDGNRRNAYPTGSFEGVWTLPDLEYAETLGAKVDPRSAMVFPGEVDVFAPLMNFLIAQRLKYGKETAEGALIKLWANSLYGKFAQEPRTERIVLARSSFDVPEGSIPINAACTAFMVPYEGTPPIPDCSHVEKAAYITSRGRIQLHRMLTARGGSDALYCDTDSVFSTRPRSATDGVRAGLGGWADEGEFRSFRAVAPKVYRYDQKTADGWAPVIRAKGIALPRMLDEVAAARAWSDIEGGVKIKNQSGVDSLRTALRGGRMFSQKDLARGTGGVVTYGDRFPDGDSSRPPDASELEATDLEFAWRLS